MVLKDSSNNLPDVFQLKTLNNAKESNIKVADIPIITNPVCHCRCHPDHPTSVKEYIMNMTRLPKLRTKFLCVVLITFLMVMVGLCLTYLFVKVNNQQQQSRRPVVRPRPLIHQPHQVNNRTLQDVFISVKTTKKYHYPRLIIQLETWASLVRSQV